MTGSYPELAGRTAVITGGSRGIGAHTARAFAAQGASVCVVGRDEAALAGVVAEITAAGGTALAAPADVTDAAALDGVRAAVAERFGPVDVLAAFAGGQGFPVPSAELTEQRWREVLDSDLTSVFLTVRAFLPGLLERGAGTVLTMSSAAGRQPSGANLAYGVANAGVVMLTRQLATELGPHGIRVNCLAPSAILTERVTARMPAEVRAKVAATHPLGRLGTPADVADAALFLASDGAGWLTGLTVDVAGGRITN
ncbi:MULTISPECIES: SDR family NAD(P)-dependent oxidoreductase [Kitasatospora]|uniref:Putative oxidoreductase n=1 Tax=Kitasatospora setae (strain ATCC 33774 / DSM 43861 / JCM 3304 / KCC A-0304 / NBRC 14216 / KM-6054) TaxID=452652 RepID=E4NGA3_KITSK|nr:MULTISPECIES: SDR family NAD(P)-dependent oxidoreductase [Kitasatospora]BAJ30533.1 putative oxidoreductase [Kitasatospora setae KM-6054]